MYSAIASNKRNTVFIMFFFVILVAGLGWIASLYYGVGIFWGAVIGAAIYALVQYFVAAKLALAVNGAHEITKADNPRLYRIVENLSITNGMPMPKVYVIEDPAPNAFATGRDPQNAFVAATTGILDMMTDRELTAVMAHEMGHVKNYDIRVMMIVFGLVSAIGFIADVLLRMTFFGGSDNRDRSPVFLLLGVVAALITPIVAMLVQAAVSRQREYLADATGAMTTRDPEGLATALEKIGQAGSIMQRQNSSTAHLFFANPLKGGITKAFSTHPPIEERVARLREIGTKM
ncbi:M48 family metallopeptidase [Candidatus Saccharibacteria bacterium]|nr:M48 family metallopeptidase [Candidatus Saccharibacteria bacterium]